MTEKIGKPSFEPSHAKPENPINKPPDIVNKPGEGFKPPLPEHPIAGEGVRPSNKPELGGNVVEKEKVEIERALHYVHGQQLVITVEEKKLIDKKTEEVMTALRGRQIGDIPLADDYWKQQEELTKLVSELSNN